MAATKVNPQVVDAVKTVNQLMAQYAPKISASMLYQATSQALSNASHNATTSQQHQNVTRQTATAQSVELIHVTGAVTAKSKA